MSTPDDSSRLSETLERLLGGNGSTNTSDAPDADDRDAPDEDAGREDTFEMPEIVPATADPTPPEAPAPPPEAPAPPPVMPTLPARDLRPSATPARPAGATTPAAPPTATPTAPATTPVATPRPAAAPTPAAAPATTSWGDHVAPVSAGPQLRTPGRRPRVRRVTRVLRHVDPWSTFKIALLFSAVAYVVALTSGVLLWRVADSTGTLDNVERWFTQFGWETFELQGGEIFRNAWIIGLFGVVFTTGGAVLLVTLFNLVSDIVGGIRMTVLEEEVVERTASSRRRYVVRSGSDLAAAAASPAASWSVDDDRSSTGEERAGEPDDTSASAANGARRDTVATPVTAPTDADEPDATSRTATQPTTASNDWSVD